MAINQLKAGTFLSYVLIGLNTLIGLLYTPFLLRMLGQSEYGLYSLAASVIAYLTVLDLGFGNAIVRYTAKFRAEGRKEEQYEMFGMFFLLYLGISLIAFILAMALAFNTDAIFSAKMTVDEVQKMRIILILMAFNLAFTFPMSIWGSIITAYENFVFQKLVNIVRTILNPLVMIILLLMGYKVIALVVVTTLFNVATLVINCIYCYRKLDVKLRFRRFKWDFLKEVTVYSIWIFLNVIMDRVYWSTGQFVLGAVVGTTAVAVYALAVQLEHMYMSFSSAITGVFLPRVTTLVTKQKSDKEISDLFIKIGRIQYIVMAFILSAFTLFGRQFIRFWAGEGYEDTYIISLMFFIVTLVALIQNMGITILMARNEMKFRSVLYLVVSVGSLFLSIPAAMIWGGVGCAVATSFAIIVQHVIMNVYYQKKQHIDIKLFWLEISKMSIAPILLCALCGLLLSLTDIDMSRMRNFIIVAMLFCVVYLPCIWFFSMNKYERNLFVAPLKKVLKPIISRN